MYLSTIGRIFSAMCWLMSKIAMSLRSEVKWLKVDSMSDTDVCGVTRKKSVRVSETDKDRKRWEGLEEGVPCYRQS